MAVNTNHSLKYLNIINEFVINLVKLTNENDVIEFATNQIVSKLGFVDCVIYLLDDEKRYLIKRSAYGVASSKLNTEKNQIKIPVGEGITGRVVLSKIGEIVNNTLEDEDYIADDQIRNSEITVPLIFNNEVIGVIDSEHHKKNFFTPEHLKILTTVSSMLANKIIQTRKYLLLQNNKSLLEKEITKRTKELEKELKERIKTE
ncbi:MAG: GAF domain-containing protein, partial [Cyclobacteriaceae bacterium]|nr:GAF domain-containing protein [Cyclobacteriaceae bacterium]